MNGEVPSVPITTLAGITSLTELLPQLPLPTSLPNAVNRKSLIEDPRLLHEVQKLRNSKDKPLVEKLIQALRESTTEHIELKDNISGDVSENEASELLKTLLSRDPSVFTGGTEGVQRIAENSTSGGHQSPACGQSPPIGRSSAQQSPACAAQVNPYAAVNQQNMSQSQSLKARSPRNSNVNGEAMDVVIEPPSSHARSSRMQKQAGPYMKSPAQATVAETVVNQTVGRSASLFNKTKLTSLADEPIEIDSDDEEDTASTRLRNTQSAKDDTSADKQKKIGKEPVVMLEPLDSKSLSDAQKKRDRWSSRFVTNEDVWASISKCKPLSISLKPLDERTLQSIASGGSVRTDSHRKGSKRRREDVYIEDERGKRRKRHASGYSEDYSDDDRSDSPAEMLRKKKKDKRQRRVNQNDLTIEELLDSPVFRKFSNAVEHIFDSAEDVNFGSLDPNDEEVECPPESLISKSVLSELCGETAKLKSLGVLNQVPADRLVKLLTILQWNVRDGTKLVTSMPQTNEDEDDDEDGEKLWREIAMERISRSMDAALTAIYIMTSPKMPKQVFLDDVIERIIMFGKFQLTNTIYPEFDPVYRIHTKDKDGYHGSLKLKRARAGQVKHKSTITLYNKLSDMVGNLAELVEIQELTDTVILQISTLGVAPFFVENISELQLNAMRLVTTVFAHYEKHRQLILEDIFASLARLPSSKRNLRSYRLNADESIQMVTALALQLIQCVVKLPEPPDPEKDHPEEEEQDDNPKSKREKERRRKAKAMDPDVVIVTSYETAMRAGYNFLSVFLKKCTMKGEDDYRPLFENFVQDLLSTVNKPEWPSSELLLSLLGRILVQQFSNKQADMAIRTASLEYLGIVAARLRKDAVSSQLNQETIDEIVSKVNDDSKEIEEDATKKSSRGRKTPEPKTSDESDETQDLQKAMLDYLAYNGQDEPSYLFARQFYIAQWFRDTTKEKKIKRNEEDDFDEAEAEQTTEKMKDTERRTKFLMTQVEANLKPYSSYKPEPSKLEYESACLVARYLSSKRPFAQSFDIYLTQILKVLSENAVAVRTKAMKCLTAVIEADPGVLARPDMERGVHGRFLDPSTSVREAAIELVGKFILIRPELIPQYYNMLSERILDTGISVRKRVIKIFREVFVEQPDFNKIPDMCVKMIRRVNDEDGIKKLVNDVFQTMWFTPLSTRDKDSPKLIQRVVNITEVVAASKDTGYEFIEQLLDNLLKRDEHGNFNKSALTACRQIVDCLVENVLRLEETSVEGRGCSNRQMACLSTLYLFSKIKPDLMVQHVTTLQPYLEIKCSNPGDYYVLHYVARILELVIPLMDHPSESFLMQVEEDMIKLILNHGMLVLESCVSCLGAVVNRVSHNYSLVKDCFQKFFGYLSKYESYQRENPSAPIEQKRKPTLLRSLFTVGLMCRHFDFDSKDFGETKISVKNTVFDVLMTFIGMTDEDVRLKALTGLGYMAVRHYEFMLGRSMKTLYCDFLTDTEASVLLRCQVLKNLLNYLQEEEVRMSKSDAEWVKHAKEEDLRDMGDVQSGMASTIMQIYLKHVLEAFFTVRSQVRLEALNVIQLVLRQGLVHPVQCVPYLISMGTDSEAVIRIKAEQQLQEIEKKYPGFIHMKTLQGIRMSYRLQTTLQEGSAHGIVRGLRNPDDNSQSLNAFLYTVLRTNRSHRRAILTTLLNLFDDSAKISLAEQLYIVDNLAFYVYQTQDEPLFIIHQIDIIVSVSGSNLLQSFRERLIIKDGRNFQMALPNANQNGEVEEKSTVYDDDEDCKDKLLERLPSNIAPLKEIILLAQGCILLLYLKQHLKDMYGFTDSKIQNYSPTEAAKVYDKPLTRKTLVKFNPESVLNLMQNKASNDLKDEEDEREKVVDDYLEFKDLMLSVDPPDEDDSDEDNVQQQRTPRPGGDTPRQTGGPTPDGAAGGDKALPDGLPGDGTPAERPLMNGDDKGGEVIEIDGEGDAEPSNFDKESPSSISSEMTKPRVPPVIISTAKLRMPEKDKDKKRGSLVRTIRLPGASQLQASAHTYTPSSQSHSSQSSSSRSHHRTAPPPSHKKKKSKKKRKRYTSDSDDDDDSDFDPSYC